MRSRIFVRTILVGAAVLCLIVSACSNDEPNAAPRSPCEELGPTLGPPDPSIDEGPCVLETAPTDEASWRLVAGWRRLPEEGSSGDGPCISIGIMTADGTSGAGWCDLPEARIIGEWVRGELDPDSNAAWGPVAAGRVARVRVEFAGAVPYVSTPKPTPWPGFDYWFVPFEKSRLPTALVALDENGVELAREAVPPAPGGSPTPTSSPS